MHKKTKKFDELRKQGYRITPQRKQILEFFYNLPEGHHLSVESLQEQLNKKGIKVSLATLYRSLKFLVSHRLLRELDFAEAHKHYEYVSVEKNHHHLICNKCGSTIEFDDENLLKLVQKVVSKQNNFQVTDYQFQIFGICKKCT